MTKLEKDNVITVLDNNYLVGDLLEGLVNTPSETIRDFFVEIGFNFNRTLRIEVLKQLLRPKIMETRRERSTLADEMNYRLSWFNQFTETQLVNLFKFYNDKELNEVYLEQLWLRLIEDMIGRELNKEDFNHLINISKEHKNNTQTNKDLVLYNNNLNELFFDDEGQIDGLNPEAIRPVLYKSSTITEIRQIGQKFNVTVPQRLKKQELLDIMIEELKDRDEYTEELEKELNKLNIMLLQRYAKDNNIKASTELKKEEVIEYVLKNSHTTKEKYYIPSSSVYEVEAKELGQTVEEDETEIYGKSLEELKQEEASTVVEEVKEEPVLEVKEEPTPEVKHTETVRTLEYVLPKEKEFDVTGVEEKTINAVDYRGVKNKKFIKLINDDIEYVEGTEEVQSEEITNLSQFPKKKRNPLMVVLKVIFIILLVAIFIALVFAIYALATPSGAPAALQKVEDFIVKYIFFNQDLFDKLRNINWPWK